MDLPDSAFVAICPNCNGIVAAISNRPERAKEIGKCIAEWIRGGLKIEQHTTAYVRGHSKICKHYLESLDPYRPK